MPLIFCFPRCFACVIVVLCLLVFRVRWFIHRHKKGKNMLGQFLTLPVQLMISLLLISLLNTFSESSSAHEGDSDVDSFSNDFLPKNFILFRLRSDKTKTRLVI